MQAMSGGGWHEMLQEAEVASQQEVDVVGSAGCGTLLVRMLWIEIRRKRVLPCQGGNRCGAGRSEGNLITTERSSA